MKNSGENILISENEIEHLMNKYEDNYASVELTEEAEQALKIIKIYEETFEEDMINRPTVPEFLKKHTAFINAFQEISGEINPNN